MVSSLKRLKLGLRGKLMAAVGLSLGLLVAAAMIGQGVAWSELSAEQPPAVQIDNDVKAMELDFRFQVQEWKNVLLRGADATQYERFLRQFGERETAVRETGRDLLTRIEDPAAHELLTDFMASHAAMGVGYRDALALFEASGFDPVTGDRAVAGMDRAPGQQLGALSERTGALAIEQVVGTSISVRRIIMFSLLLSAALVVATLFGLSSWINRGVVDPVRNVVDTAQRVARGDFTLSQTRERHDEIGELDRAMRDMVGTLDRFSTAQQTLAEQHDQGMISERLDEEAFAGAYGVLARRVNELLSSHLEVQGRMAEVVAAYAQGDFSAQMEALPGEKARITEAMNTVRDNLESMKEDILRLSAAAGRGDFSARGEASRYRFAFREMVEALNSLMEQGDAGLSDVGRVLGALAEGDLTQKVERRYEGAFGRLAADANRTTEQLSVLIGGIQETAESVRAAAREIAAGNTNLSQRTEEQAASLEETASSMEEMTSTVSQNADNARQADQLARGTHDVAGAGGQKVRAVVSSMGAITESARKIENIISVIDGIAFQTNILALNAAVEAARAGEQGRGFAVVASEVRTLAQRSAQAAKEIKTLIGESVDSVEQGNALVSEAGETMNEIVTSIKRVTDIMSEISAASDEQREGIQQVNTTVSQLDEMTQQNAALVEQASAAAGALEQQADQLSQSVSVFRLRTDSAFSAVAAEKTADFERAGTFLESEPEPVAG